MFNDFNECRKIVDTVMEPYKKVKKDVQKNKGLEIEQEFQTLPKFGT